LSRGEKGNLGKPMRDWVQIPVRTLTTTNFLKKSVRNPLTNFKTYDIIKIQRARVGTAE